MRTVVTVSTISRRRFLRAKFQPGNEPLRPPWAVGERLFAEICTRCNACITACAAGILHTASDGLPEVDFSRGECTFCAACSAACRYGALATPDATLPAWEIRAAISTGCLTRKGVMCTTCREHCATGAISLQIDAGRVPMPYIDPQACTGCGACVAPCPAGSIHIVSKKAGVPARETSCI